MYSGIIDLNISFRHREQFCRILLGNGYKVIGKGMFEKDIIGIETPVINNNVILDIFTSEARDLAVMLSANGYKTWIEFNEEESSAWITEEPKDKVCFELK